MSIFYLPFSRIIALKEYVRHNARHSQQYKEYRAAYGHAQTQMSIWFCTRYGINHIGHQCLHPKVQSPKAKATEGTNKMHNTHIGLLEVAHNTNAQTGNKAKPYGQTIVTQQIVTQIRVVFE